MNLMLVRDEAPPKHTLRPYQIAGVEAVLRDLSTEAVGTLLLMATGTGKTQTACEIMHRWLAERGHKTRILFLAHRDELIQQAARRIDHMLGFGVDTEKAEHFDEKQHAIVVGSVQTMCRAGRLARHRPDAFSLIIVDECHHAASDSYVRILDHFTGAKRLGLTATATRADGKKLGAEWETIAFEYGLRQAIADGYLVPIRRKAVMVEGLRLDDVKTRGGDLVASELEAKVLEDEATVHAWARGILDTAGDRKVIAFCPGVESSRRLAECLNRYAKDEGKEEIAVHLDGETDSNDRRLQLARFTRSEFRVLTNCGLFLEGYDEPSISCVAMCRPTKSPTLYVQCLGRGTRLFPPDKTDLLVIDFTSNSQRHDIVTAIDILADDESEEIKADAEALLAADPLLTVEQGIAKAKQRAEAKAQREAEEAERRRTESRRAHIRAKAQVVVFDVDGNPDAFLGVSEAAAHYKARRFGGRPLSPKQLALVEKAGYQTDQGSEEGQALDRERFNAIICRINANLCTVKQANALAKRNIDPTGVTMQGASAALDALAKCNWRPSPSDHARIDALAHHVREPGEEG